MEAIVLAGGLGTRLRSVINDRPKPMAPIGTRPFLALLLDDLRAAGFTRVTLAVGYKHENILRYFGHSHGSLGINYSVEQTPLGTGGAILQALTATTEQRQFVINGDTYIEIDYRAMLNEHIDQDALISMATKQVPDTQRYGALVIEQNRVRGFIEKGRVGAGLINGGVYLFERGLFDRFNLPQVFSFEADLLKPHLSELDPLAFASEGKFIDIGIPEDYDRAQLLLAKPFSEDRQ